MKKPIAAIGSFDIFNKLSSNASSTTVTTKVKPSTHTLPNPAENVSTLLSIFNHEEGAALKKGRSSVAQNISKNVILDLTKSEKEVPSKKAIKLSSKMRKSVKFRSDGDLIDVRYFNMDDTPLSIV